jgi:hypothetical protein
VIELWLHLIQPIPFVLFNIAIVLVSAYYQKSITIPEIRHLLKFMFFSLCNLVSSSYFFCIAIVKKWKKIPYCRNNSNTYIKSVGRGKIDTPNAINVISHRQQKYKATRRKTYNKITYPKQLLMMIFP